jgi:hypothetical protein
MWLLRMDCDLMSGIDSSARISRRNRQDWGEMWAKGCRMFRVDKPRGWQENCSLWINQKAALKYKKNLGNLRLTEARPKEGTPPCLLRKATGQTQIFLRSSMTCSSLISLPAAGGFSSLLPFNAETASL